ncbi:MAG: hypothetical protein L7R66_02460 [Candidatus Thalassarchaeaceae archaeon]|nr:hypothetical protein [Candidatus Thalassarchaeaceae archaeon]
MILSVLSSEIFKPQVSSKSEEDRGNKESWKCIIHVHFQAPFFSFV